MYIFLKKPEINQNFLSVPEIWIFSWIQKFVAQNYHKINRQMIKNRIAAKRGEEFKIANLRFLQL